ncbi:MAG: RHS repeat domain-containing protein [Desulfococcaceae bacterium]
MSDGIRDFVYDQRNRLARLEIGGATVVEYAYDAFHRRVKKVVDGETTYFHSDADGLLICETDASGNAVRDYVYLNGEPAAMRVAGSWYWFLNDHLGTPRKMVDASGAVVWKAAYLPFGRAKKPANHSKNGR